MDKIENLLVDKEYYNIPIEENNYPGINPTSFKIDLNKGWFFGKNLNNPLDFE